MEIVIILLIIIAIGVLLQSPDGKSLLSIIIVIGTIIGVLYALFWGGLIGFAFYESWGEDSKIIFWSILIIIVGVVIYGGFIEPVLLKNKNIKNIFSGALIGIVVTAFILLTIYSMFYFL